MDLNLHFDTKNLTEKQVSDLTKSAVDFSLANGVLMQSRKAPGDVEHAPFMLFPSPFPKKLFDQAKEVQQDFNILVHKISQDHEFLKESLQGTITVDEFTGRIYDIYEQTRKEGIAQPISLGLLRSDYMLDSDKQGATSVKECDEQLNIKQVEVNTIASSFGCLGSKLPGLGSYVLGLTGKNVAVGSQQMPVNSSLAGIAEGLAQAWEFYGSKSAVVLMVITDNETNKFDQKLLEYYLCQRKPSIRLIRRSLTTLYKVASLDNKKLMVEGYEVAVVYFRAGYTPENYPSEDEWSARLLLERSLAIKSPTAALHLVGTKKVQQVLAEPGVLERFISDEASLRRIKKTFTGLYTLDEGPEGEQTVKMALQDPEKYVLKPQREGGGNNFYGDDIKTTLNKMKNAHERSQYILMDKIRPPSFKNYIIRPELEKPVLTDVISELGIFGVLISLGDKVLVSKEVGHLMRTKSIEHQDGGVASGRANLDSPYLF
ncbi:glutathione synthetase-like [Actinia tenebrosa]|uniref:Glutathione synthetase n=1 Tax=Actinia tenebrosa TaxID=6105 RepID=A0A6P8IJH5_ACTTE|nr:glutathione synthetase-like [Actinia tenebrosa]